MNRLLSWCVVATALLSSSFVHAAPTADDKDLAKKLYQQAAADMEREAYDRACPQFEAALKLDPEHIRTAMTLGTCEDRWGKLARALQRFEYARSLAEAQSAKDKLAEIDQLMADLNARLPKLRIVVPEHMLASGGWVVVRNGATVRAADFGRALPIDPGTYEMAASAPERATWKAKVDIKLGQTAEVIVGSAQSTSYRKNPSAANYLAMGKQSSSSAKRSVTRTVGFTGMGIGAAGIVGGGILGGLALLKYRASNDGHCNVDDHCDSTGTSLRLDAQRYGHASTAFLVVGGALLTTGIILVATSPSTAKEKQSNGQLGIWIGLGSVGLRGHW